MRPSAAEVACPAAGTHYPAAGVRPSASVVACLAAGAIHRVHSVGPCAHEGMAYWQECVAVSGYQEILFNLGRPLARGATIQGTQDKEYIIHSGEM